MTQSNETILVSSQENEMMVLGSIVNNYEKSFSSLKLVYEEDFVDPKHKIIFRAIRQVSQEKEVVDVHLVATKLMEEGTLKDIGGAGYLMTLAQYAGTSAFVEEYCDDLRNLTVKRQIISLSNSISNDLKQGADSSKIIEKMKGKISEIEKKKGRDRGEISSIKEIIQGTKSQIDNRPFIEKIEERQSFYKTNGKAFLTGIPTGFCDLDKQAVILEDTSLIIVAARPAMGKTALALNISSHTCIENSMPVGIISLEMGRDQLLERLISSQTRISGEKIKRGTLTDEEFKKIALESEKMSDSKLFIVDRGCSTIQQVVSIARRLKDSRDIRLLAIDYLQLLGSGGSSDSRQYEVAEISRSLKILALELKIPILCVAQLSRKVEERNDKKPLVSDLRDSGQIEQDADAIVFLYRRSYYDKTDKPNEAELLLRKNRHGPEAEVKLYFDKECGAFSNLANIKPPMSF
jgi:replicative DNA helicase